MREFVFFSLGVYVIRIQSVGEKATKSSLKINILRSSFVLVNVKRRNSKKYEDWWSLIQENLCLLMLLFNDFYIPHLYLFILQFLPFIFGKPLNPFPHNDGMPHQWFFLLHYNINMNLIDLLYKQTLHHFCIQLHKHEKLGFSNSDA